MNSLTKFLKLSRSDKGLFLHALTVIAAVRLGLTISSYKAVERRIAKPAPTANALQPGRIAWAVRNMARAVPGASCLTQALACQHLMARAGKASSIRIGVAQGDDGRFTAHAWLIWEEKVVIGGADHDLSRYASIADLAPGSS
jgi:hypothetical protein